MQTCDPLTARLWFKLREAVNWAVTIVVFVPLVFVLMHFLGGLLGAVIAIALSFCLYFFVLDKRVIRIKCPYGRCREIIDTNTPWICGHKGCKNDNPDEYPFIYKCEHCGNSPKAYKCHHCGELIFFTDDEQKTGYAECANYVLRAALVKKREGHQETVTDKREVVESKGLDVEIGKLDIRLKRIDRILKPPPRSPSSPPTSPPPRMPTPEAELAAFMSQKMGIEDAAEKYRAIVMEKWKHDPGQLKKHLSLLEDWVRSRGMK